MEPQLSQNTLEFLDKILGYSDDLFQEIPEYSLETTKESIKNMYSHMGSLEGQRLKSLESLAEIIPGPGHSRRIPPA